jgi:hypothetical protein
MASPGIKGQTRLLDIDMPFRKVTCHPSLFDGAVGFLFSLLHATFLRTYPYPFFLKDPGSPCPTDKHLIQRLGKMTNSDKLLASMKEKESRALIFTQISRVLDIFFCFGNLLYISDHTHTRFSLQKKPSVAVSHCCGQSSRLIYPFLRLYPSLSFSSSGGLGKYKMSWMSIPSLVCQGLDGGWTRGALSVNSGIFCMHL